VRPIDRDVATTTKHLAVLADTAGMFAPIFTWHDLHPDHGVLELHEHCTPLGLALELHVVVDPEHGGSLAWWQTERGDWLGCVLAGEV
jgi:hypothetical protein